MAQFPLLIIKCTLHSMIRWSKCAQILFVFCFCLQKKWQIIAWVLLDYSLHNYLLHKYLREKKSIKPDRKMCFANLLFVSTLHKDKCLWASFLQKTDLCWSQMMPHETVFKAMKDTYYIMQLLSVSLIGLSHQTNLTKQCTVAIKWKLKWSSSFRNDINTVWG